MDVEKPYKEGFLLFPPQGVLGQLKKTWHKKYCQLFRASKHGIERLEVFDSEEDVTKNLSDRIITLENCVKITQDVQKHHPNSFIIVTKTVTYHFAAVNESEMMLWLSAFQSVAFKDDCSKQTIEEHNDLYDSSGEGVFTVWLVPSEASERCGLEPGVYTLVVASAVIQLRSSTDNSILFTWPYRYIRRYGYREGKFIFEAGRKCDSGEGTFTLQHSNQQEIFRCLSSKMKSMRKLLSGETPVSPVIMCGDNQFQAALSMEARSRSPLPPSPTSATLFDTEFSTISQPSSKFLGSVVAENEHFVVNSFSHSTSRHKPKPVKPPRKQIQSTENISTENESTTSDSVSSGRYKTSKGSSLSPTTPVLVTPTDSTQDYDDVEVRKDAWRTLGVDDIRHTENQCSDEEDRPNQFSTASTVKVAEQSPMPQCSKILATQISTKSDSSEDYDKLQHFRPPPKPTAGGYSHVPVPSVNSQMQLPPAPEEPPSTFNDYELFDKIQACRLADDSHYGYGMIRKKSVPSDTSVSGPEHQFYNDQEYAVVQKPKKV